MSEFIFDEDANRDVEASEQLCSTKFLFRLFVSPPFLFKGGEIDMLSSRTTACQRPCVHPVVYLCVRISTVMSGACRHKSDLQSVLSTGLQREATLRQVCSCVVRVHTSFSARVDFPYRRTCQLTITLPP